MAALRTRYASDFTRRLVEIIVCKVYRKHTKNNSDSLFWHLDTESKIYLVHGKNVWVLSLDGKSEQKMKGVSLSTVPFCGSYISSKELHTHIPKNWPGWEPTASTLGRCFFNGIFDSWQGDYPESPFELSHRCSRNHWLSDNLADTKKRLLS
jgi:hypothetical protein